ncbi:hypothetical protein MTO96_019113 [Rhipicephalus appendiculatus]
MSKLLAYIPGYSWRDIFPGPELELLDIAEEIDEYGPWKQSSPRGENWMWQVKIDHFKRCLEHVLLKPFAELGAY